MLVAETVKKSAIGNTILSQKCFDLKFSATSTTVYNSKGKAEVWDKLYSLKELLTFLVNGGRRGEQGL